ncbi:hypothetical protein WDZ92_40420 [Nostoc sp. NIES-2111]
MTYSAVESILCCGENLARKKLASKKLKALFGEHLKVGKNSVLNRLNNAEAAMVAQIDHHDIEPLLAIKKVIEFLRLVPIKPEATLASCA